MNGTPLTLGLAALAALVGASRRGSRDEDEDDDPCYEDEGEVGGHWGRTASGVLVTDGRRVLLLMRSWETHMGGVWGIPGGAIPLDCRTGLPKDAKASALDETVEEMGGLPRGRITQTLVNKAPDGFVYTTLVWRTTPEALSAFEPDLNWEHTDAKLFPISRVPKGKTHPGVLWALPRLERS